MGLHSPAVSLHRQQRGSSEWFRRCLAGIFQGIHKRQHEIRCSPRRMILKQAQSLRKETCWAARLAKTNYLGLGRHHLRRLPRRKQTCSKLGAGPRVRRDPCTGEVGKGGALAATCWFMQHAHTPADFVAPVTAIRNQEGTCIHEADVSQELARARLGWDTPAGPQRPFCKNSQQQMHSVGFGMLSNA